MLDGGADPIALHPVDHGGAYLAGEQRVFRVVLEVAAIEREFADGTRADDLAAGARPGPWMALDCVQQLKINAVGRCVKVDDTAPGIEEGVNAGMWTVGLALSGSPAGLTLEEYRTATPETLQRVRERVSTELRAAGAHYIIDSVADLPALLTLIQARMSRGETPSAA